MFIAAFIGLGGAAIKYWDWNSRTDIFNANTPQSVVTTQTAVAPVGSNLPDGVTSSGLIDLNTAPVEVLDSLPGIGPAKAAAIIDYRTTHGGFRDVQELANVKGISVIMANKLAQRVCVSKKSPTNRIPSGVQTPVIQQAMPARAQPPSLSLNSRTAPPVQGVVVNINTASASQLESLKHIGPKIAQKIIEYRNMHGPFPTVEALDAVKGVGPHIIEANRGLMTVR